MSKSDRRSPLSRRIITLLKISSNIRAIASLFPRTRMSWWGARGVIVYNIGVSTGGGSGWAPRDRAQQKNQANTLFVFN